MALVSRLAGALLAETCGAFYLVGDLKEPCDFEAAGFDPPPTIPGHDQPFIELVPRRAIALAPPLLRLGLEGPALAQLLFDRLVIERNGSVSNRLWRLVTQGSEAGQIDVPWFAEMPSTVWNIVREGVLKCS